MSSNRLNKRWISCCLVVAALAGCGGGGSQATLPSAPLTSANAPSSGATVVRTPAALPGERARSADAFVDSAGLNIHMADMNALYGQNPSLIRSLISTLGVRHVRDGDTATQTNVCNAYNALGNAGIWLDVITSTSNTNDTLDWWHRCLTAAEMVEGPNEYDLSGDPSWAANLVAFQGYLYSAIKAIAPLTVIAPALTSTSAYGAIGSLGAVADVNNMHDYFAGRNPGTGGWGGTDRFGTYGSLAWNMNGASQPLPGKPVIATETGYSDAADPYAVPPATKARYVTRTLLEHWNAGVQRTYLYELLDEGDAPFSHYGIVDASGNPKPAYRLLQNLLSRLADPGGSFTPGSLTYALGGNVHHTLLQKRNGAYDLVLWVEQQEWNPDTNAPMSVAPQAVTIALGSTPRSLVATTFDDNGNAASAPLPLSTNVSLNVTGSPTLIEMSF